MAIDLGDELLRYLVAPVLAAPFSRAYSLMIAPELSTGVHRSPCLHLVLSLLSSFLLISGLMACGGGGRGGASGSQPPPPPPPPTLDFSLAVSPTSQVVSGGTSASVSLSATAINGFSSQVSVQVSGLPASVSVSPTSITLTPGTPQQISLSAAANASTAAQTVTFTGTSGSLTHTTQLSLSVTPFTGLPTRTRYVRTDATTDYFESINQHWIIYHAGTGRYFVTDPSANQVIVIDAPSEKVIARIIVPEAFGIDDTPDHSLLYVGTLIGDVYSIDPVGMTVTNRYMASQIGPYGFFVNTVLGLADGQLALIGGPSTATPGSPSIAIWNPSNNSIVNYGVNAGNPTLPLPCPGGTMAGVALSADRTQIILGFGGVLCEMNGSTGTVIYSSTELEAIATYHLVVTPDGKYIILPNNTFTEQPAVAVVFDAQTLAIVAQFNVLGDTAGDSSFFVSPDSTTLYTPTPSIIYAYDLATQKLVGWLPNIWVQPFFFGSAQAFGVVDNPYFLATDGTGLLAGPLGQGIGFLDLSTLQTGAVGTQFTDAAQSLNPATGPISGGTETQWIDESPVGTLTSIDFDSQPATSISATAGNYNTSIDATSPAGTAGPADVYLFTDDGGMQLLPEAFSYGPTVLEVTPNMATAEGGGTGYIYGYGFGSSNANTDLNVTVGGLTAQISAFLPNAYGIAYPPFPLQGIAYTIPPGVSGSVVNVSVSTNAGSTTESGALSYLPPTQQFPLTGSTLAQGIYDSYTGLYYFTDTNQIQVFSRTQGSWQSPISIPAPSGATQRLWGIALSPDGSKLAVSDVSAGVIYVLDPSDATTVKTFVVNTATAAGVENPSGVAISDAGFVYYAVVWQGISGGDGFYKLDTSTGQITDYGLAGAGGPEDAYYRVAISTDNSRAFFNNDGYVFYVDTATGTLFPAPGYLSYCCYGNYDLALSSNQTQFEATSYTYDFNLNPESLNALNDREILNIAYVYGAKLSPDGRLFFQPSTNGIDVFNGELGNLLNRISLPFALSPNYDALVDDGTDNILVAITGTGNGIAIVDLTSISEPPPLPYNRRSASRRYGSTKQPDPLPDVYPRAQQKQPVQPSRAVRYVTRPIVPHTKQAISPGSHTPDR